MKSKYYILYHNDPDGWCAGYIAFKFLKEKYKNNIKVELYPLDYGKDNFLDKLSNKNIILLDYSLQPFKRFKKFTKKNHVIWIDHHKTAIEYYAKEKFIEDINVYIKDGIGACILTYNYFFNNDIPFFLYLVGNYDVWKFPYGDYHFYLVFYMNFYMEKFRYLDNIYFKDLEKITEKNYKKHPILKEGRYIFNSWLKEKINILNQIAFERKLFGNYKCIIVNGKGFNSLPFERSNKYRDYDIWVVFYNNGNDLWNISLYSKKVDVSSIAKKFGGGGHKYASGFQCNTKKIIEIGIINK